MTKYWRIETGEIGELIGYQASGFFFDKFLISYTSYETMRHRERWFDAKTCEPSTEQEYKDRFQSPEWIEARNRYYEKLKTKRLQRKTKNE